MGIHIRTCDDWIAVYKDGVKVWDTHSCSIREGLEVLGIPFTHEDLDDQMDYDLGCLKDGSEAFPNALHH